MRQAKNRLNRFRSQLLRLEDRVVPALVTTFRHDTGVLAIACTGGPENDSIVLTGNYDRDGVILLNGSPVVDSVGLTIPASSVSSITITGGSGGNLISTIGLPKLTPKIAKESHGRVSPPSNGMAINQKGTGAEKNRTLPVVVSGGEGDDTILGGSNDEWLIGGGGTDVVDSGPGNDLLTVGFEDVWPSSSDSDFNDFAYTLPPSGGAQVSVGVDWTPTGAMQVSASGVVRVLPGVKSISLEPPPNEPDYTASLKVTKGDYLPAHNFKIEIDGVIAGGFRTVSGPGGVLTPEPFSVSLNFSKIAWGPKELALGDGDQSVTITPGPGQWSIDGGNGVDRVFIDNGGYSYTEVGNEVQVASKGKVFLNNFDVPFEHGRIVRDEEAIADLASKGIALATTAVDLGASVRLEWTLTNNSPTPVDSFSWGVNNGGGFANSKGGGATGMLASSGSPGVTTDVFSSPTGASTVEIVAGVAIPKFIDITQKAASVAPSSSIGGSVTLARKHIGGVKYEDISFQLSAGTTRYEVASIKIEIGAAGLSANAAVSTSSSTGQTPTDAASTLVGASADGSVVLTSSTSRQLAPDGNPLGSLHLYASGQMVDLTPGGTSPNGPAAQASIDASGRFVAFLSSATNLLTGVPDSNGANDVFLRDLWTGTTHLVSRSTDAIGQMITANAASRRALVCADGSCVIFESQATNLIPGLSDTNNDWDVFRFDVNTGTLTCLSLSAGGAGGLSTANAGSSLQGVSADGNAIVWVTSATDLESPPTTGQQVVYKEINKATPLLMKTLASSSATRAYISSDGGSVVITADGDLSSITGIPDTNGTTDLFHMDAKNKKFTALSTNLNGTGMGNGPTPGGTNDRVAVSYDGSVVVCATDATDLLSVGGKMIATWDLATAKKARVAATSQSSGGATSPALPSLSPDGRIVTWQSYVDMENAAAPPLSVTQVWSMHLASGHVDAVSGKRVAGNPLYEQGNQGGSNPLYTNGRVLFNSSSTNLASGDTNAFSDVYATVNHVALQWIAGGTSPQTKRVRREFQDALIAEVGFPAFDVRRPVAATDLVIFIGGADADTFIVDTDSGLTGIGGILFDGGGGSDSLQSKGSGTASLAVGDLDGDGRDDLVVTSPGICVTAVDCEALSLSGDFTAADAEVRKTHVVPHVFEKSYSIAAINYSEMSGVTSFLTAGGSGIQAAFTGSPTSTVVTLTEIGGGLGSSFGFDVDASQARVSKIDAFTIKQGIYVAGGVGDETITTGSGNDTITGGGGTNIIDGAAGALLAVFLTKKGYDYYQAQSALSVSASGMLGGVTIDLGSTAPQNIAPGMGVQFSGPPRIFEGTDCDDKVTRKTYVVPHVFETKGGRAATFDTLVFDAEGSPASDLGGRLVVAGKAPVDYSEFESVIVINNAPAPQVAFSEINGGAAQRSLVQSITLAFNSIVAIPNPAAAFQLQNKFGTAFEPAVDLLINVGYTVAKLTFTDPMYVNGSLPDGQYTLTVVSSQITGGLVTGDHTIPFHRQFGDVNGDTFTDNVDFIAYRQANGSQTGQSTYNPAFDFNGDGFIDNNDFIAFRQRIGMSP